MLRNKFNKKCAGPIGWGVGGTYKTVTEGDPSRPAKENTIVGGRRGFEMLGRVWKGGGE